jgi:hypothetical protein
MGAVNFVKLDAADPTLLGAIVLWSCHGPIRHDKLRTAWLDDGLDEGLLLSPTSPYVALRRAMELAESDARVRPMRDSKDEAVPEGTGSEAEGFVYVYERRRAGRPVYERGLEVVLDKASPTGITFGGKRDADIEDLILAAFERTSRLVEPSDVGAWLRRLAVKRLNATTVRDTGGVYFIPPVGVPQWLAWSAVVETASSRYNLQTIPAMRTKEAISAVLSAFTAEIQADVEKITEQADDRGGDATSRFKTMKAKALQSLFDRVVEYEGILGQRLTDLRDSLEKVSYKVGVQMLLAGGEE